MKLEVLEQIEKSHGISSSNILTVSQVSQYIKDSLCNNPKLQNIYVFGEVTNASEKNSYIYFDIKDEQALLRCVVFPKIGVNLSYKVENGLEILVLGSISTYEKRGLYQIIVSSVFPLGEGAFYLQFKQLKKKLSNEGIFDEKYKKETPVLPKTIGLITSKGSAACNDVLKVLKNRCSNITVKLINTLTQGDKASLQIIQAIQTFNKKENVDVILVVRGGGSIEDLMCFNNEQLARCIFSSKIPIITGIGHETNYTIADFVSDKRAATPSVAAKLAVVSKRDLIYEINSVRNELQKSYKNFIASKIKDKKLNRYKVIILLLIIMILIIVAITVLVGF